MTITYEFGGMEFWNGLTARGTITTDGTLGFWPRGHASGILDFDITFAVGDEIAIHFGPADTEVFTTVGLFATPESLSFYALVSGEGYTQDNRFGFLSDDGWWSMGYCRSWGCNMVQIGDVRFDALHPTNTGLGHCVVPEPATAFLTALALVAVAWWRRR